jgi:hypothetical protein
MSEVRNRSTKTVGADAAAKTTTSSASSKPVSTEQLLNTVRERVVQDYSEFVDPGLEATNTPPHTNTPSPMTADLKTAAPTHTQRSQRLHLD